MRSPGIYKRPRSCLRSGKSVDRRTYLGQFDDGKLFIGLDETRGLRIMPAWVLANTKFEGMPLQVTLGQQPHCFGIHGMHVLRKLVHGKWVTFALRKWSCQESKRHIYKRANLENCASNASNSGFVPDAGGTSHCDLPASSELLQNSLGARS